MTLETIVNLVEVFAAILALLWFSSRPWREFLITVSQQHYFALNNRLLLMVAEGRLQSSNVAYRSLRRRLNVHLKFVRTDMAGRLFLLVLNGALRRRSPLSERLLDSIDTLEEKAVRDELHEILWTSSSVRMNQMLASSPLLCLLILMGLPAAFLVAVVQKPNWISTLRERTEQITSGSIAISGY